MTCENIKNVTIIGGTRGLGKWIAQQLSKEGLTRVQNTLNSVGVFFFNWFV